jgi:hypothetical protein
MAWVAGAQEMDGLRAHDMVGLSGRAVARTGRGVDAAIIMQRSFWEVLLYL